MNTTQMILMMIAFEFKHFLADFPLQTAFHLGKGKKGVDWILPLASHAGVHAVFTLMIVAFVNPALCIQAALIDFVTHFIIDRIKATSHLKPGAWDNSEKGRLLSQWYLQLGIDQMCHHIVGLIIVFMIS